jgi:phosphocarrier protein FPr
MQTIELTILNKSGLHARPLAQFVKTVAGFRSRVRVENLTNGKGPADGKSMLGLLGCAVHEGHQVRLTIEGEDEEAAAKALTDAVNSGLGEALD